MKVQTDDSILAALARAEKRGINSREDLADALVLLRQTDAALELKRSQMLKMAEQRSRLDYATRLFAMKDGVLDVPMSNLRPNVRVGFFVWGDLWYRLVETTMSDGRRIALWAHRGYDAPPA